MDDDSIPADNSTLIVSIIFPIFGVILIILIIVGWRRRKRMRQMAMIPRGPLQQAWYQRISSEISLRIEQEEDPSKGTRVWFSRHIDAGRFKHWILIIDDVKYELRRDGNNYYVNIAPCVLDVERRNAVRERIKFPEYDGHYVCLIGWTRRSPAELKEIAHLVGDNWDYSRMTNNCQHFLREFSDRILEAPKAADYGWFRENTPTEYQDKRTPPPTPEELRAMHAVQQQVQQQHHQHTLHNQHNQMQQQHMMHTSHMSVTNQQIMMNLQMQNLQTMNMINLMAITNNPAMNPAMNPGNNPGMMGGMGMGGGGA